MSDNASTNALSSGFRELMGAGNVTKEKVLEFYAKTADNVLSKSSYWLKYIAKHIF